MIKKLVAAVEKLVTAWSKNWSRRSKNWLRRSKIESGQGQKISRGGRIDGRGMVKKVVAVVKKIGCGDQNLVASWSKNDATEEKITAIGATEKKQQLTRPKRS